MKHSIKKESFVMYKSFYELIEDFTNAEYANVFKCIFEYQLSGKCVTEPISPVVKIALKVALNQFRLDEQKYKTMSKMRSEFGKRGGIAKATKSYQEPDLLSKAAVKDKDKDKDKEQSTTNRQKQTSSFKENEKVANRERVSSAPYIVTPEKANELMALAETFGKGARRT